MFGFRLNWIFRSRWLAIFWCGLIVWLAVDMIGPEAPEGNDANASANAVDITGAPVSEHDIAVLRDFVGNGG
jgi:hypothetical protein